ncbi:hypothetical protein CJ739_2363 [Mariniflexile rhizosphaerae]|uniref:hypothetical protein n=1 Tax=unclassified Mariniflexile TaxID=2643887 RepID=UPI000CB817C9|nr:hypothetical protein [Mariniflexile sp. TRM1-10]AXP81437.1 hypothetical protein CJ739_2363 [Mariniflexile sp. TRM1-10]PLB18352.1 MAG: hypothetical protein TRG1_2839 [Flavobacteriaceae bacterium FS1-H7996/R]
MNRNSFILFLVFSFLSLCNTSCLSIAKDVKSWIEVSDIEDVRGKYHFLTEDQIKIYLPDTFKKYSRAGYEKLLDSLASKKNYELEIKRLEFLRNMEGNFHIFFDEETRSTYTINTMPYMPMHKGDAQYILGMISMNNDKISRTTDLEFTKITAKYSANACTQIFKAIHKIENKKKQLTSFNSSYIVSANSKTIYIQLLTGFDVNFDPFLQKMIL